MMITKVVALNSPNGADVPCR